MTLLPAEMLSSHRQTIRDKMKVKEHGGHVEGRLSPVDITRNACKIARPPDYSKQPGQADTCPETIAD